jgi:hypothetical protein
MLPVPSTATFKRLFTPAGFTCFRKQSTFDVVRTAFFVGIVRQGPATGGLIQESLHKPIRRGARVAAILTQTFESYFDPQLLK